MNLTSKLAIASLLAGITLPAMAQDATSTVSSALDTTVSTEASAEVSAEAGGANVNANANANANASADNYGNLISSLQAGATADLTVITDATTVNFVTVSTLKATGEANALDNALEKNKDAVAKLRTDVGVNAALSAKLTAAGYSAEDVVAVVVEADASVTVYIDDRA
jgi:hypothetical protein